MSNLPATPEIIDQLRQYKIKNSYTNAQTAAAMAAVGWGTSHWSEGHVIALMNGAVQPTEVDVEFIKVFLLLMFYAYNCT